MVRQIADFEMELVSGGMLEDPPIIIEGGGGGGFGPGDVVTNPGNGGSGGSSGGSGSDGSSPTDPTPHEVYHPTVGVSDAANAYADNHVRIYAVGDKATHSYQAAHDDVAKIYDLAKNNSNALVDIGHGKTITAAQALAAIDHDIFEIRQNTGATSPGGTQPVGGGEYRTIIDTSASGMAFYENTANDAGLHYVIFHEIGHALNFTYNSSAGYDQASANTAGRSLEQLLGIPTISAPGSYN